MKSSYELAMERLEKASPTKKLTSKQMAEIEEIDSIYKAKLAERETFLHAQMEKAKLARQPEEVTMIQAELARDLKSIRAEWEEKKEKVRAAKSV